MKPSIGRIVHFYDTRLAGRREHPENKSALNGSDIGPYPAMVVQTFDGPYVNLLVHAWGGDWREGSVTEKSDNLPGQTRYWVWPPVIK